MCWCVATAVVAADSGWTSCSLPWMLSSSNALLSACCSVELDVLCLWDPSNTCSPVVASVMFGCWFSSRVYRSKSFFKKKQYIYIYIYWTCSVLSNQRATMPRYVTPCCFARAPMLSFELMPTIPKNGKHLTWKLRLKRVPTAGGPYKQECKKDTSVHPARSSTTCALSGAKR